MTHGRASATCIICRKLARWQGFRCASEPLTTFIAKGGDPAESPTECLAMHHGQRTAQHRNGTAEAGLLNAGTTSRTGAIPAGRGPALYGR